MKPTLPRFRLIDGVIVATLSLLGLKVLGLFAPGTQDENARRRAAAETLPSFGRVVAHARSNYAPADPLTTGSVAEKPKDEPAPQPAPPMMAPSPTERALLERLGDRREELQQRAREMEAREKLLQEQERRIEQRLGQAKAQEDADKGAASAAKEAEAAGLKSLVTVYEGMKPKEAARVFDRLPMDILVSVVTQMNARKMSEVMAAMSPEAAEKLTVALAKRAGQGGGERVSSAGMGLPPGELSAIERPRPARKP